MKTSNNFFHGFAPMRARLAMLAATLVTATVGLVAPAQAQSAQTITFGVLADKPFNAPPFTVSATSDSGLTVSFGAAGDCTVAGSMVSLTKPAALPGTCTITALQAGGGTFGAAVPVAQTFAITQIELYAVAGSALVPSYAGDVALPVWSYNSTGSAATQPGGAPIIVNQGDTVTIRLHNTLTVPTSLLFQGQNMVPDASGVAPGATKTYTFVASQPGTFLYEAGLLSGTQYQAAMGLHGALIVRPTASTTQAYSDALTAFDDEAVLVLSEIDPVLNESANPVAFDMRNFAPLYYMINGKAYPSTEAIATAPGRKVLLRYVNAGMQHHSMAVLGLRQNFVAKDAGLLPTLTHNVAAETLAPGQTGDAIVTVPATAAANSKFALYDGSLKLYNDGVGSTFGGMLTFVAASGTAGTSDTTGPATSGTALSLVGILNATVSDVGRGSSNVIAAEYFLDSTGANGDGVAMNSTATAGPTRLFSSPSALVGGNYTVFVHGQDAAGNWGPFVSIAVNTDTTGPTTSALTLLPNPTNGLVNVALAGTANDTLTGGSNITQAEYTIDGGPAVAMVVNPDPLITPAKVAGLAATIPAATVGALSNGNHTIAVRSRDSAGTAGGYWGNPVNITLTVIKTLAPVTSNVSVSRTPNNGTVPLSATQQVVRVTASVSCATTCLNVGGAEGFIDTAGANGTGFPFVPADGAWNGLTESVYADIPLSTIATLPNGPHTIYVHSKEAVGVWETPLKTVVLTIDKTPPTVTSATLSSATVAFGPGSTTLNVVATDAVGLSGAGQYWIDGGTTPPANPTAFTGNSATINTGTLTGGTHTVYVRVQDTATNWSAVSSVTLTVVQAFNDTRTINANGSTTQTNDANAGAGVLANDQPIGVVGRTAVLASVPVKLSGTGSATIALSCVSSLGTPVSTGAICANGAYRVGFTNVTGSNNNQRAASKRGTYQFTYTETLNGVTSTATVTITVN